MKHNIHYSDLFLKDLDEIGDYISSEYNSNETALNFVKGILNSVKILSDFPYIGQVFFLPDGTDKCPHYSLLCRTSPSVRADSWAQRIWRIRKAVYATQSRRSRRN